MRIFLALVILLIIGWSGIAPLLGNYLVVTKSVERPDAMIVLSGSSQYVERCRKAAEVYRERRIPIIYLSNDGELSGWSVADQQNVPFLELEKRELIANGVAPESIRVLDGIVRGTDDEAKAMSAEAKRSQLKSLLIVTSAYHSRRALRVFELMFATTGIAIGIEHAPLSDSDPSPMWWWLSVRGWQLVGGEYVKSAVYWAYS